MTATEPDWPRLGNLLVTRRVQLNPRYKNRRAFVADTHSGSESSWYRIINAIEKGTRGNYARETYAAMEVAYQLQPGSLVRTRDGGELEPLRELVLATGGDVRPEPTDRELPPPDAGHDLLDEIRNQARAQDKTLGDILVERGLATPEELTLSDQKRYDGYVKEILDSDLSEETKDYALMQYAGRRRVNFRKAGVTEEKEPSTEKSREVR